MKKDKKMYYHIRINGGGPWEIVQVIGEAVAFDGWPSIRLFVAEIVGRYQVHDVKSGKRVFVTDRKAHIRKGLDKLALIYSDNGMLAISEQCCKEYGPLPEPTKTRNPELRLWPLDFQSKY